MNRKSLITCLSVLAVMVVGIVVAVAVLYHDGNKVKPVESRFEILQAVPSNAVVVGCFAHAKDLALPVLSGFSFPAALSEMIAEGGLGTLAEMPVAFSLHYSGKLTPLYVFNVGEASPATAMWADELVSFAKNQGLQAAYEAPYVLMAETETLVKSSIRHMEQSLSIIDAPGFNDATKSVTGDNLLFVSYAHARPLFSSLLNRKHSSFAAFAGTLGDWAAFSVGRSGHAPCVLSGQQIHDGDASEFMSVLAESPESVSGLSDVLPSYTTYAVSIPMTSVEDYLDGYKGYLDSKQMLSSYNFRHNEMRKSCGISPVELMQRAGVTEVAKAAFGPYDRQHEVCLVNFKKVDSLLIRNASSFVPSVFGPFFGVKDASCMTVFDDWLVIGSAEAVEEYESGRALEYTLKQYMKDAGSEDMLASKECSMLAYMNFTQSSSLLSDVLKPEVRKAFDHLYEGIEYAPMVFMTYEKHGEVTSEISVANLSMQRVKAPVHERDTVVTVPTGPFKVKNSGTGRMNLFYQNAQGAICLKEETGAGIWGVPFGKPLCGRASTVDFYANGKLQIIFASEDKVYLIDRLGRFVTGFPLNLGKPIRLGPDVYDFNGARAYNIMVLHNDNTIEMYNLKGKKPASWKGIVCSETIKDLPERIEVGGKTFWVVRTSIQTLIYPFEGGNPLTVFEGQKMILPTSGIKVVDGTSVQAETYGGKTVTIKLK